MKLIRNALFLGTSGKATRMCDELQVVPWQEPDMFNCTTSTFYQLRKQVSERAKM